ncbi:hypothetical protein [Maridesulfovibrio sp.]|uniref:hypothetical protein n=1 Tax=Maridesulfovibrio sp. TaxID=2795000 RepID=UPI002A18A453|nr:hypothetical protein [Maridesulfovibrio sp.]
MQIKKYFVFTLFMLLAFSFASFAQASSVDNGTGFGGFVSGKVAGSVNWGNGLVSATSVVCPMQDTVDPQRTRALALRQGGVEARRMLLKTVLNITLDGGRTVSDILKDDLKTMNTLRGFIQNSLLKTTVSDDGSVEVTAFVNLWDGLSSIIIPPTIPFLSGIAPTIAGNKRSEVVVESGQKEDGGVDGREAEVHSGIVIDARGFNLNPVLLPIVYDGHGVGVYGAFAVSRDSVMKHGLVAYMVDGNSENFKSRVGSFPLTVKPVNTQGSGRSDFIVSLEDGAGIRAVLKRKSVGENCAVVILMDRDTAVPAETVAKDESGAPVNEAGIVEESLQDSGTVPDRQ